LNEDGGSTTVQNDTTPPVQITVVTSGTLSAEVKGTPASDIVLSGTSGVSMAKYEFTSEYEEFTIEKLDIIQDGSGAFDTASSTYDNNIVEVSVAVDGVEKGSGYIVSGKASLTGLDIEVPADESIEVEILADINTMTAGASSGDAPRLGISTASTNNFRAVGNSGAVKSISDVSFSGESDVNSMTVRYTEPTVSLVSNDVSLTDGTKELIRFTVEADDQHSVDVRSFTLDITMSDNDTNTDLKLEDFALYDASDMSTILNDKVQIDNVSSTDDTDSSLGSGDTAASLTANVQLNDASGASMDTVSAGDSVTYVVKATVSNSAQYDSIITRLADDSDASSATYIDGQEDNYAIVWRDGKAGVNISSADVDNLPTEYSTVDR
jgi:hypothetical protein